MSAHTTKYNSSLATLDYELGSHNLLSDLKEGVVELDSLQRGDDRLVEKLTLVVRALGRAGFKSGGFLSQELLDMWCMGGS